MHKIAVIGAGLMGHGIAQVFASKGHEVNLVDLDERVLDLALQDIRKSLKHMADHGLVARKDIETIVERIRTTTDMAAGAKQADFVVEAVTENLALKQNIFKVLDEVCPDSTVLASNTSVISITQIAEKSDHRERMVGTHFWNPPTLIPLVEVVPGDDTSAQTVDKSCQLLAEIGKHPVRVKKDVPGFVGNRLQHALWREAISIVENGIADAATVDECVKFGFGLRLPALGPMENADMVGTDLTLAIHEYILAHIENTQAPLPVLKGLVENGDLGFKTGRGFQAWPRDKAEASHMKLQQHLLKIYTDRGV